MFPINRLAYLALLIGVTPVVLLADELAVELSTPQLPSGGAILVPGFLRTDDIRTRIVALDTSGNIRLDPFIDANHLQQPIEAILSPDGREIWVANQVGGDNDQVLRYDLQGVYQSALIADDPDLPTIGGISLSHDGNLLVTVYGSNDDIRAFTSDGDNLGSFLTEDLSTLGLDNPVDILRYRNPNTDEEEYLVTFLASHIVARFDLNGGYKSAEVIDLQSLDTAYYSPYQISRALNGNILVATFAEGNNSLGDNSGHILEFSPNGSLLGTYSPLSGTGVGNIPSSLFKGILELPSTPARHSLLTGSYGISNFQGGVRLFDRDENNLSTVLPGDSYNITINYPSLIVPAGQPILFDATTQDTELLSGETLSYTLSVTNISSAEVTNVVVTDDLPEVLIYQGASGDCDANSISINGNLFSWTVDPLSTDSSLSCTIQAQISYNLSGTQKLLNEASVSTGEPAATAQSWFMLTVMGSTEILINSFE